jgi:hypothetical protein
VNQQASFDLPLPKHRRKRKSVEPVINAAFAEALRDAADIRQWTDGSRAPSWRIYRLAQALTNA